MTDFAFFLPSLQHKRSCPTQHYRKKMILMNNTFAVSLLALTLLLSSCGQKNVNYDMTNNTTFFSQEESFSQDASEALEDAVTNDVPEAQPASVPNKESATRSGYKTYAVAFYNLENLFDAVDDPTINDEDFLPDGVYQWDNKKYETKLNNMSTVLADIATDQVKDGPAVIGVAEVENRGVCMDLVKSKALRKRAYSVLHFDSPDRRGIDCAMLYNPKLFHLEDSLYVQYINPEQGSNDWLGFRVENGKIVTRKLFGDKSHLTRGFLVGIGTMAGEKMAIIVNHWPSRGSESYMRERAGRQVKRLIEALQECYPGIKVISMGDLNDDPDNKSLSKSMACKYDPADVKDDSDIFNPWLYMLRTIGQGTLLYKGEWNLFDQIVMTGNLVDKKMIMSKDKPAVKDINLSKGLTYYYNEVFNRDYMSVRQGQSKGGPKRSIFKGEFQKDGYSDHFPTCIYLLKEK